jgi:hypothetical protein
MELKDLWPVLSGLQLCRGNPLHGVESYTLGFTRRHAVAGGIHYMELKVGGSGGGCRGVASNPLHGVESVVFKRYCWTDTLAVNPLHGVERFTT